MPGVVEDRCRLHQPLARASPVPNETDLRFSAAYWLGRAKASQGRGRRSFHIVVSAAFFGSDVRFGAVFRDRSFEHHGPALHRRPGRRSPKDSSNEKFFDRPGRAPLMRFVSLQRSLVTPRCLGPPRLKGHPASTLDSSLRFFRFARVIRLHVDHAQPGRANRPSQALHRRRPPRVMHRRSSLPAMFRYSRIGPS
jgi:hypothetical protein